MYLRCLFLLGVAFYKVEGEVTDIPLHSMDEDIYQRWPSLSLEEKLPYLLDTITKATFTTEYEKWLSYEGTPGTEGEEGFTEETMLEQLKEFRTEEEIAKYFRECDTDHNYRINYLEFIVCRGWYNSYAEPLGLGEYDVLESIVINDYEEKRNDPNYYIPGYKYDENGIIID